MTTPTTPPRAIDALDAYMRQRRAYSYGAAYQNPERPGTHLRKCVAPGAHSGAFIIEALADGGFEVWIMAAPDSVRTDETIAALDRYLGGTGHTLDHSLPAHRLLTARGATVLQTTRLGTSVLAQYVVPGRPGYVLVQYHDDGGFEVYTAPAPAATPDDKLAALAAAVTPAAPMPEITRRRVARLAFANSKDLPWLIDDRGRRRRWVGIGWIDEGPALGDEHARVVDDPAPDNSPE